MKLSKFALGGLALSAGFILIAYAESAYAALKIYKITGNVTIKTERGTQALKRRDIVKSNDVLSIPAGSSVEIHDTETQGLYASTLTGSTTVQALIDKSKRDAKNVTQATNGRIWDNIKRNAESKANSYNVGGVSVHNTDGVISSVQLLPEGMSYLTYLMQLSPYNEYDDSDDLILLRRDYPDDYDTFNFSVFNTLDEALYVNVIEQKPNCDIKLFFNENPLVKPRGETVIPQYRYIRPEEDAGYIIIASEKNFTLNDVKRLLEISYSPEENYYISLYRP